MTDSLKLYYYESASWTQVGSITEYPTIIKRTNDVSSCQAIVADYEGALFAAWEARNFTKMKIEDASANVLFIGYLHDKEFTKDGMLIFLRGFASKLERVPFRKNFILEDGLVGQVPSTTTLSTTTSIDIIPNGDSAQTWTIQGGEATSWESVSNVLQQHYIHATDGDENNVEVWDLDTITIDGTASKIVVSVNWGYVGDKLPFEIDFYNGTDWEGYQTITPTGEVGSGSGTTEITFSGMSITNAKLADCQLRVKANAAYTATDWTRIYYISTVLTHTTYIYTMELTNEEGDPFTWTADQWTSNNNKDVGILIVDNTNGLSSQTYTVSGLTPTGHTATGGNAASCNTLNDGDVYYAQDNDAGGNNVEIAIAVDGANIADSNSIERLTVNYRVGMFIDSGGGWGGLGGTFSINNNGTYDTVAYMSAFYPITLGGKYVWREGTLVIDSNVSNYLDKTGANYDSLKGFKFVMAELGSNYLGDDSQLIIDYISVTIEYEQDAISPIMLQITDNDDTSISCDGTTWSDSGVAAGDKFQIGENTEAILDSAFGEAQMAYSLNSTLSKYMARFFRATYSIEVLKAVALMEGLEWFEDHEHECIVISKDGDLEDSGVDLTSADYAPNFKYTDHCNNYYRVEVYGNASLAIYAWAEDLTVDSPLVKQIVDDTIMTLADAQEVADEQLTLWKVKRPSIFLELQGVNYDLQAGKTVDVTLERPTKAKAAYPIRRLDQFRVGEHLITRIYIGRGSTPVDEKIAQKLNSLDYTIHRIQYERIVGTPWTGGAAITASDIGGLTAAIQSISINNTVEDTTPQLGGALDTNGKAINDDSGDNTVQINDNLDVVGNISVSGTVDGVDIADVIAGTNMIYAPYHLIAYNGFIDGTGWTGGFLSVAGTDADARIKASFHVANGGNFKVLMSAGRTAGVSASVSGNISVGQYTDAEAPTNSNLIAAANFDFTLTNDTTHYELRSAQVTIDDDQHVDVYYQKDANEVGGTFYIHGLFLERQ